MNEIGVEIVKKLAVVLITIAGLFATTSTCAESQTPQTRTGNDFGLTLGAYKYQEPGIMSSSGPKMGLDLRTIKLLQKTFVRFDMRYALGQVNYTSNRTGSASGEPDWYLESRGLIGRDFPINNSVYSPYAGLGYRYLFNDARGLSCTSSTCYWGYRRESNYLYLPVGIIHRTYLSNQSTLVSTLEYDHLLAGKQISRLSDGGQGNGDVTNKQSKGYGLKLSIIYEQAKWAIGPYVYYWNIAQSDWVPQYQNGLPVIKNGNPVGGVEPKNNTIEFGMKASQQF